MDRDQAKIGMRKGNSISLFIILLIIVRLAAAIAAQAPAPAPAAATPPATAAAAGRGGKLEQVIGFDNGFNQTPDVLASFKLIGGDDYSSSSIDGGALQLTPDSLNEEQQYSLLNKSGRILYHQPFKLWPSSADNGGDDGGVVASFNTYFLINIYRKSDWDAGHGLAFIIAPDLSIPDSSYGQWLGLTNVTTDGNAGNQIVAIEFDTEKQDFDLDDNHVGLNINSVISKKAVSVSDFNITLSPASPTNYSVWVQYDGKSKLMEVYMAKQNDSKPATPILNETINLKQYVKQESFFGFSASTGSPEIELNCVLQWTLDMEIFPDEKDWLWLKIGAPVVTLLLMCLVGFGFFYVKQKRRRAGNEEIGVDVMGTLKRLPGMPREFRYKDLKKATKNFDESMRLGQGGFGIVYKGVLQEEKDCDSEIAVKMFSRDIKGKDDFLAELTIIHRLRHKHLVRLVGWCYEKAKLLLVYDFMPNGSLEKHLYEAASTHTVLNWERRYKILSNVASALHYLHNEYDQKVVHRDLKASNIMLDSDFNARLGDFGLARALDDGRSSYADLVLGGVPGTMGYVAPECFHTGKATPESDVFGFGAVVLEVVCGKRPGTQIHHNQHLHTLVDWVWSLHREGRILEAVDENLKDDYVVDEATRLLLLGLACSHPIAGERPQTQDILQIISGTVSAPLVPPFKPMFVWPSMNFSTPTSTQSSILSSITVSSS